MELQKKSLWELLWDYDPNGLIVVNTNMVIQLVNPAFCTMFKVTADDIIGTDAAALLDNTADFRDAWERNTVIRAREHHYAAFDLHLREVIFPIRNEGIIAGIMVNLTHEWKQQEEIRQLRRETIKKVNEVVDNQMKVAQEIASLLGETTAETKVSLLRLIQMIEHGPE